jgi:arabinose-5-phosphate isomerase
VRHNQIKIQLLYTQNFKHSVLISRENILAVAKKTILSESESITKLIDLLDENFADAAQAIYNSNGRLVVTGIGKSAIIAQKMVATFNSQEHLHCFFTHLKLFMGLRYGTEGRYYHLHFKSGNSPEIKAVVPFKTFGSANTYNRKHDFVSCKNLIMY